MKSKKKTRCSHPFLDFVEVHLCETITGADDRNMLPLEISVGQKLFEFCRCKTCFRRFEIDTEHTPIFVTQFAKKVKKLKSVPGKEYIETTFLDY